MNIYSKKVKDFNCFLIMAKQKVEQDKITLTSNIINDKYTEFVYNNYDIQNKELVITEIPKFNDDDITHFKWNIGVILGNSGSGKSTLLKSLGEPKKPIYDDLKCVISQFERLDENEAAELLHGVGISSIPTWLKRPSQLSNGEKARLDLAMLIYNSNDEKYILIDEFTSVVNRPCAESMSFSLQRYARKHDLKMILASCHYDIIEYLKPDWIFNLNKKTDGVVSVERLIYSDDEDYKLYTHISQNKILSDKYEVI